MSGLEEYLQLFPGRVQHSKSYRSPRTYKDQKVLLIGNSSSGHDIAEELRHASSQGPAWPIYQSRRSRSRFDGDSPPEGIEWRPVIKEFLPTGRIVFEDDTYLDDIDIVLYCTGYRPSFSFWNAKANGGELWSYEENRLLNIYQHTFFHQHKTLALVGLPRTVTFRSFEYQAIAIARLFSGRNRTPLPPLKERRKWEEQRVKTTREKKQKFHDIPWDHGETLEYLGWFFEFAGLQTLKGEGRRMEPFTPEERWVLENVRKYPLPGRGGEKKEVQKAMREDWVVVEKKDGVVEGENGDVVPFVQTW